jgi:DNA polymerase-1
MANLTIVDGHSYLYGAFYGVPDKAETRAGKVRVDAVYGFFALLRVIVEEFPKNKLFIVFDSKKWFKKELENKTTDADLKDTKSLIDQQAIIQKILDKIGIKWVQHSTLKADNIIASLATYWATHNGKVQISSGDFDFVQLISKDITIARNIHGLITKHDKSFIKQKFGIAPDQYMDFQALIGDENDDIIGVHGIGPRTAAKLLNEYKNIAGIYNNIDKLPKNFSEKLVAYRTLVLRNQKNIPMTRDIPIGQFLKGELPDVNKKLVMENVNTLLAGVGIK